MRPGSGERPPSTDLVRPVPLEDASTEASTGASHSEASAPAFSTEVDKALEAAQSWREDVAEARRAFAAEAAARYGLPEPTGLEEAEEPEPAAPEEDADEDTAAVDALLAGNA